MSMKTESVTACAPVSARFCDGLNVAHRGSRYPGHETADARSHESKSNRFNSLVLPHAPMVLRAAHVLVSDAAEADDIAQETMIKAFKALGSFQNGTDMRAWLMTILRNTRIDHIRAGASSARNVSLEQLGAEPIDCSDDAGTDGDPAWDNPDELLEAFSDCHVIAALHKLPADIRWTLLLVEIEEMDHEDAAMVMGVPVGTVQSRAFRGRAMLRKALLPAAREFRLVS